MMYGKSHTVHVKSHCTLHVHVKVTLHCTLTKLGLQCMHIFSEASVMEMNESVKPFSLSQIAVSLVCWELTQTLRFMSTFCLAAIISLHVVQVYLICLSQLNKLSMKNV